jgi:hypothetical protein
MDFFFMVGYGLIVADQGLFLNALFGATPQTGRLKSFVGRPLP